MSQPKPSESRVRDTRAEMIRLVLDQARACGISTPDTRKAERFIDPIINRSVENAVNAKDPAPASAPEPRHDDVEVSPASHYDKVMPKQRKDSPLTTRARLFMRWLRGNPETREFREKMEDLGLRLLVTRESGGNSKPIEAEIRKVLHRAYRLFGDPRNPDLLAPKIMIHGR